MFQGGHYVISRNEHRTYSKDEQPHSSYENENRFGLKAAITGTVAVAALAGLGAFLNLRYKVAKPRVSFKGKQGF